MKRFLTLAVCLLALCPRSAAQINEPVEYDMRGRFSAEIDKKIADGFHISFSEEFRMKNNFTSVDRFHTSLGLSYKPCPYFKMAASYTLINLHDYSSSKDSWSWKIRHRASFDLVGLYRVGNFKFNLRERIQYTYKAEDMNVFENPKNEFVLRSRLKASYQFRTKPVEPYLAVELRNTLNAVSYTSYVHESEPGDNVRYDDVYLNRVRINPGVEWRLSRRSSLDFYMLADYVFKKDYDANKQGDLKQENGEYLIYHKRDWNFSIGVGYSFAF